MRLAHLLHQVFDVSCLGALLNHQIPHPLLHPVALNGVTLLEICVSFDVESAF